jgi:DNA-binding transcriptional regulator GbsR (MarR family)
MICEPAHQSSQALAETLQASTGSVSMQTRQLEQIGLVETITFPGDRATYFHLRPHVWAQVLSTEHERIKTMNDLAIAGLEVLPTERPDRVTELQQMSEFLIDEWPSLLERLETYLVEEKQL